MDGVPVGQVPAELDRLRALYKQERPSRVLEIGCWYGGTLREWLTQGNPDVVVAIDPTHMNTGQYEGWRRKGTELHVGHGESQSAEMLALIRAHGPYDWIFIDGDHSVDAVGNDVTLALGVARAGALILLHDITTDGIYPPTAPRDEFDSFIASGYETWEIIEPRTSGFPAECAHGTGVVRV